MIAQNKKQVQIVARVVFKADSKKVCYLVRSSDGAQQYTTCLFNGRACSCTCKATKPCYHMVQVQEIEAARVAAPAAEVVEAMNQALEEEREEEVLVLAEIDTAPNEKGIYKNLLTMCLDMDKKAAAQKQDATHRETAPISSASGQGFSLLR